MAARLSLSSKDLWCRTWDWLNSGRVELAEAAAQASASLSSEMILLKMSWVPCPQYSLSLLWELPRQEKLTLRSTIGLIIAKVALSMETGSATFLWWLSRRLLERLRDAWNVTMLLASKVALQLLTSRLSSTTSRTKTGMARPKLSYQTTLSV